MGVMQELGEVHFLQWKLKVSKPSAKDRRGKPRRHIGVYPKDVQREYSP